MAVLSPVGAAQAAPARAWFWLSSDQIRALRDASPASALVLKWTRHTEVIEPPKEANTERPPPDKHPDGQGTIVLGPDYLVIDETDGQKWIYDYRLQRSFALKGARTTFGNTDLLMRVQFEDAEAQNRYALGKALQAIGHTMAMWDQPYYEAELGVRTRSAPALQLSSSQSGGVRNFSYKGETLVSLHEGASVLTPQQGAMFAKALRLLHSIHPAAVDAIQPLRTLPSEVAGVRDDGAYKDRNTFTFELVGQEIRPYPLPAGLPPTIHSEAGQRSAFTNQLIDIGLKALSGNAGPKPTADNYAADAKSAYIAGDAFGAGLAWIALSLHYPDQSALCDHSIGPAWCAAEKAQLQAAARDGRFRRFGEGSALCSAGQSEKGARVLSELDISGEKYGYVVNAVMACLLRGVQPSKAASIVGTRFPATSEENDIRAFTANPFIPGFYYDTGMAFVGGWDYAGWPLLEIGEALGGGVKGDPYDLGFNPMRRELMARYPERF